MLSPPIATAQATQQESRYDSSQKRSDGRQWQAEVCWAGELADDRKRDASVLDCDAVGLEKGDPCAHCPHVACLCPGDCAAQRHGSLGLQVTDRAPVGLG
jgi:hypothetical protein